MSLTLNIKAKYSNGKTVTVYGKHYSKNIEALDFILYPNHTDIDENCTRGKVIKSYIVSVNISGGQGGAYLEYTKEIKSIDGALYEIKSTINLIKLIKEGK